MCLGELGQVRSVGDADQAEVVLGGVERSVSLMALSGRVAPGDWVVVHSGFALERLTADEARAALALRSGTDPDSPPDPNTPDIEESP